VSVSGKDRDLMRRIGALKAESHAQALARHLELPLGERLRRSWSLYLAARASAGPTRQDDDPSAFYRRARDLGFCDA
jgi:hypothetical protein